MRTHRRVHRDTRSFEFFPTALKACALRCDRSSDFDPGQSVFVESERSPGDPVDVEMKIAANLPALASQAGVPADALSLSVILQDFDLRRVIQLCEWNSDDLPSSWRHTISGDDIGSRSILLTLVVHLNRELERQSGRPWRRGSAIAERDFKIVFKGLGDVFTVLWTSFIERRWQENSLYHVEFGAAARFHEESLESSVTLYLNRDLPALVRLLASNARRNRKLSPTSKIMHRIIAAMMLTDVAICILSDLHILIEDEDLGIGDIDEDSATGRVLGFIETSLNLDPLHAAELAATEPHRLREEIQHAIGVGGAFDQSSLDELLGT